MQNQATCYRRSISLCSLSILLFPVEHFYGTTFIPPLTGAILQSGPVDCSHHSDRAKWYWPAGGVCPFSASCRTSERPGSPGQLVGRSPWHEAPPDCGLETGLRKPVRSQTHGPERSPHSPESCPKTQPAATTTNVAVFNINYIVMTRVIRGPSSNCWNLTGFVWTFIFILISPQKNRNDQITPLDGTIMQSFTVWATIHNSATNIGNEGFRRLKLHILLLVLSANGVLISQSHQNKLL